MKEFWRSCLMKMKSVTMLERQAITKLKIKVFPSQWSSLCSYINSPWFILFIAAIILCNKLGWSLFSRISKKESKVNLFPLLKFMASLASQEKWNKCDVKRILFLVLSSWNFETLNHKRSHFSSVFMNCYCYVKIQNWCKLKQTYHKENNLLLIYLVIFTSFQKKSKRNSTSLMRWIFKHVLRLAEVSRGNK